MRSSPERLSETVACSSSGFWLARRGHTSAAAWLAPPTTRETSAPSSGCASSSRLPPRSEVRTRRRGHPRGSSCRRWRGRRTRRGRGRRRRRRPRRHERRVPRHRTARARLPVGAYFGEPSWRMTGPLACLAREVRTPTSASRAPDTPPSPQGLPIQTSRTQPPRPHLNDGSCRDPRSRRPVIRRARVGSAFTAVPSPCSQSSSKRIHPEPAIDAQRTAVDVSRGDVPPRPLERNNSSR
jgi:hypothetical protein